MREGITAHKTLPQARYPLILKKKKAVRRVFHHAILCRKEMGKQALRFTKQDFKPQTAPL